MTDIEIARSTPLLPIAEVAQQIGIDAEQLEQYGKHVAKVPLSLIDESKVKRNHLILVTSITATKAGIGKTTVSIGLALGLNHIGKRAVVALRHGENQSPLHGRLPCHHLSAQYDCGFAR